MEIRTTLAGAQLPESTAVAIGCFDGVHLAHRRILENVIRQKKNGLCPAVFTFSDSTNKNVPQLVTTEDKLALFKEMGIELVYLLSFQAVKNYTAKQFVTEILQKICGGKDGLLWV